MNTKKKGLFIDLTAEFTSIVYLSNEENNGTFIYNLKKPLKDTSYEKNTTTKLYQTRKAKI